MRVSMEVRMRYGLNARKRGIRASHEDRGMRGSHEDCGLKALYGDRGYGA